MLTTLGLKFSLFSHKSNNATTTNAITPIIAIIGADKPVTALDKVLNAPVFVTSDSFKLPNIFNALDIVVPIFPMIINNGPIIAVSPATVTITVFVLSFKPLNHVDKFFNTLANFSNTGDNAD